MSPDRQPQTGTAALLAALPAAAPPGPGAEEAAQRVSHLREAQRCLAEEAARGAAALDRAAARRAALQEQVELGCAAAEEQHEGIAVSLNSLAGHLGSLAGRQLSPSGQHLAAPPLLSLDLPDCYSRACTHLLDLLAGYVQLRNTSGGGTVASDLAEAQQHQRRQLELEQLQGCLVKAERLRVEEEAELARLQAELEVLRAPSAAAASLGYSAADLAAEVASLQRRQATHLEQAAEAAEVAAAAAAGADVVDEQAVQRRQGLEQRVQAKEQVAAMLARHLARQLLVRQLLEHEQRMTLQVQAAAAAARADAEAAVQAAQCRLPGYEQQPMQPEDGPASAAADGTAGSSAGLQEGDHAATAQQLLACRAQLQGLQARLQADMLPAHQAVFAELHSLLYASSCSSASEGQPAAAERPQLTPPALQAQLADVAAAHQRLSLQANSLVAEVLERQAPAAASERALAEAVLVEFWSKPQALAARAEEQRRRLEQFV